MLILNNVTAKRIYIPVWIDLKKLKDERIMTAKDIYIPVWIDLKLEYIKKISEKLNLHSSMDRFEDSSNIK